MCCKIVKVNFRPLAIVCQIIGKKKCYVYGWICVCECVLDFVFFCYCFIGGLCSLWKNEKIYLPHLPIPPHPDGNISIGCLCVWWHHCLFFSVSYLPRPNKYKQTPPCSRSSGMEAIYFSLSKKYKMLLC